MTVAPLAETAAAFGISPAWADDIGQKRTVFGRRNCAKGEMPVLQRLTWLMKRPGTHGTATIELLFRDNLVVDQSNCRDLESVFQAPRAKRKRQKTLCLAFSVPVCKLQRNSSVFRLERHCNVMSFGYGVQDRVGRPVGRPA